MNLIRKLIKRILDEGLIKFIGHAAYYLLFNLKIKYTTLRLNLLKLFKEPPLVIKHGRFKINFNDDGDYTEILYHAHWKKYFIEETNKIKSYVNDGDIVIDIGANIGIFTLIFSDLIGERGKVYSFEPCKILFEKLKKNVGLNNLKNVVTFKLGMGSKVEEIEIYFNPQHSGLSSIIERVSENCTKEKIGLTTLDKFTGNLTKKISFIKIDTEGFEPQVLKGGVNLLQRDKPVIYVELGGKYQEPSRAVLNILKKLNYKCEAYSLDLSTVPPGTNFIALSKNHKDK